MSEAWIIDACRTPRGIGKQGKGALADMHPQRLGASVLRALADRNDLDGMEDMVVAGGTEMTSRSRDDNHNPGGGMHRGNLHLDSLHPQSHQGVCADAIATLEGISRQALDELGAESQRRAAVARR